MEISYVPTAEEIADHEAEILAETAAHDRDRAERITSMIAQFLIGLRYDRCAVLPYLTKQYKFQMIYAVLAEFERSLYHTIDGDIPPELWRFSDHLRAASSDLHKYEARLAGGDVDDVQT